MYICLMKNIHLAVDDFEYDILAKEKGKLSWKDYFLRMVKNGKNNE